VTPLPRRRGRVLALAVATLALLGPACQKGAVEACPGEPVATLQLQGTLVDAATHCDSPAVDWISVGQVPPTISAFIATIAADPDTGSAALCTGRRLSATLYGTLADGHVHVEAATEGAVLGGCAATCTARLTVTVDAHLVAGADGVLVLAPETDTEKNTLVEQVDPTGGPCGACTFPCISTYTLAAVPR
jgi:hypothetical protein